VHPIGGNGFDDPATALFPGAAPGAGGTPLDQPFTLPRPSTADLVTAAPAPGSGQGSAVADALSQFAADNRLLVTAGLASLVGAALIGPRAANVAALADVTFTNVRLVPCVVKDGVTRGGSTVTGAVTTTRTFALESAGRAFNAVQGAHETGREAIAQAGRQVQEGFSSVVDARPRDEAQDGWSTQLGVIIALVYVACIGLALWVVGARPARSSDTL
jgi:hypothetical protein